ncbi:hypothetical protein ASF70_01895 [Rhizobium sp. Leaf321]|uniref:D-apionate lactonase n=1 Tax=Rhizobium sp. Leaf321 TaxID=1736335 RepID=UPI0007157717|nr:hypothetical protein [Rhizobium sp. Leaf321]KQQ78005.1 hypothetical protein ASF70_01895 [Rhizobium sp. Leaf321]
MSIAPDHFALYGTHARETPPVRLTAGKLSVDLSNGNLRSITYDGVEVLRAISYLVRDRDWGTYNPDLTDLDILPRDGVFTVAYSACYAGPAGTELTVRVSISGDASGSLTFSADALSSTGFETNRCGFCILHPIVGLAGSPVTVAYVDGRSEETCLPDLIEPWQPFQNMRAITHTVLPGVVAECRMDGDTFEMEDQRNWSDASYKTYVRPLALPWPYTIEPSQTVAQAVTLTVRDHRPSASAPVKKSSAASVVITHGSKTGTFPKIGLIITPEEAKSTLRQAALLAQVAPQELLFHFDPLAGHNADCFIDFAAISRLHTGTITLEIALACQQPLTDETVEIAEWMQSARFRPNAVVISPDVDRQSTPPGSTWPECPPLEEVYAAARNAFPGIRLGGGMLSYFTELNRKRVPADNLDFISHCTNPIVHAADDLSVMQTLEALPFITRSVREIYGDKPYRIGPSTIPMRQNPYGSRTLDNPGDRRIAMASTDPRHNGFFAAAFAMAYASGTLDAGLECLTLSALTGPFGLVAGRNEPTPEGEARPLLRIVHALAGLAGRTWKQCISSDPTRLLCFEAQVSETSSLWLINITAEPVTVDLTEWAGSDHCRAGVLILAPFSTEQIARV